MPSLLRKGLNFRFEKIAGLAILRLIIPDISCYFKYAPHDIIYFNKEEVFPEMVFRRGISVCPLEAINDLRLTLCMNRLD